MTHSQYQTLAEAAFEGVAIIENLRIIDANAQLAELLGYASRDDLIGESFERFLPAEDVESVRRQIQHSIDVDVATLQQQRLVRTDGTALITELRGKLVHEDETTRSILVVRDVTDWERAQRELKTAYADLEQFSHIASHDLRAPLRALDNLSQWVIEDLGDDIPEESANHLRLMRERIERMDRLLNDLLRYARAAAQEAQLQTVDVQDVIDQTIESVDVPAGMHVEVVGDLPVFETALAPLKQVFVNLISNAVHHHDRPEGHITVSVRPRGAFYEFSVADDGPGIEEQFHDKIFEVFQTLKAKENGRGTGMGLTLVKRFVESAGGSIEVESKPSHQRGATFRFTWPRNWNKGTS